MAIQDLIGTILLPDPGIGGWNTGPTFQSAAISASDGGYGTVFQAPKSGDIDTLYFATATVTTGATITAGLEAVSLTTGFPTGTPFGTNTFASVVIGSGDDNVFFTATLTAAATVTEGELLAFVLRNPTASFGSMVFAATAIGNESQIPYGVNTAVPLNTSTLLMFAVRYTDGTVVPIDGIQPPSTSFASLNMSTSQTPDVGGWRFTAPANLRVCGGWCFCDRDGDVTFKLVSTAYNQGAATGILASTPTLDANVRRDAASRITRARFTAPYDLVAGTTYRFLLESSSTTTSLLHYYNALSALLLDAWPMGGCLTTAKDPTGDGDWTNYNAITFRRPLMGLMVSGFDSGGVSGYAVQQRLLGSGLIG
jgi:hypothetical protein